jgi:ATP/maltotriose-dependent transcriptional regulator MalT
LLHGLARLTIDGRAVATPTLQQAAKAVADIPVEDVLRWGWLTVGASTVVWDFEGWRAVSERQVKLVREAGALASLPIHLAQLAVAHAWMGDFTAATSFVEESASVAAASGSRFARHALLTIQVLQGRQSDARAGITSAMEHAGPDDLGAHPHWATAVLHNSLARYEEAASAAWQAAADSLEPWWSTWALPELVEAASRTGDAERAAEALDRLSEETQPCGNDIALGLETRCRALLSNGDAADHLYREAIERLSRTRLRPDLARAHLLYGEWLRREGRRVDARRELNDAYEMFSSMGMEGFAERARRELLATGAKVSRRTLETRDDLTPQEAQIARLARDGLSNPEIGTHLFLSPRTVEWHLRKVFGKLGINTRRQLRTALPEEIGLLTIV